MSNSINRRDFLRLTGLAAAGGKMPVDRPRDGVNLIPHLNGSIGNRPQLGGPEGGLETLCR